MATDLALARTVGRHQTIGEHEAGDAHGRQAVHDVLHPVKRKTPDAKWRAVARKTSRGDPARLHTWQEHSRQEHLLRHRPVQQTFRQWRECHSGFGNAGGYFISLTIAAAKHCSMRAGQTCSLCRHHRQTADGHGHPVAPPAPQALLIGVTRSVGAWRSARLIHTRATGRIAQLASSHSRRCPA